MRILQLGQRHPKEWRQGDYCRDLWEAELMGFDNCIGEEAQNVPKPLPPPACLTWPGAPRPFWPLFFHQPPGGSCLPQRPSVATVFLPLIISSGAGGGVGDDHGEIMEESTVNPWACCWGPRARQ